MDENPVANSLIDETPVGELKPAFVSVKGAGRYLGDIVPREVYRLLDRGDLEAVSHGRRRLVTVASLEGYRDKLLDQLKQPAAA